MRITTKKIGTKLLISGMLGIGFAVAGATASQAAGITCFLPISDNGTQASTVCQGTSGSARIVTTCNAIWPFPVWTDYGSWFTVHGTSILVTNDHAYCAAPLTNVLQIQ